VHAEAGDWFELWHWVGWGGTRAGLELRGGKLSGSSAPGSMTWPTGSRMTGLWKASRRSQRSIVPKLDALLAAQRKPTTKIGSRDRLPFGSQNRTFPPEARRAIRERTPL
jgi:hypothetical protein